MNCYIAYGQGGLKLEINIPVLYWDIFRCFLSKHPDIQEDILSAVKQRLEECYQELKTATLQVLWLDSICKASRRKHDNKIQNEWNSYPITRTSRPRAQEFVWKTRYSWTSKGLTFFSGNKAVLFLFLHVHAWWQKKTFQIPPTTLMPDKGWWCFSPVKVHPLLNVVTGWTVNASSTDWLTGLWHMSRRL